MANEGMTATSFAKHSVDSLWLGGRGSQSSEALLWCVARRAADEGGQFDIDDFCRTTIFVRKSGEARASFESLSEIRSLFGFLLLSSESCYRSDEIRRSISLVNGVLY